jgi:hypothetical protein
MSTMIKNIFDMSVLFNMPSISSFYIIKTETYKKQPKATYVQKAHEASKMNKYRA